MCSLYFTSNCRYRVINKIHPCLSHANSFFLSCLHVSVWARGCGLAAGGGGGQAGVFTSVPRLDAFVPGPGSSQSGAQPAVPPLCLTSVGDRTEVKASPQRGLGVPALRRHLLPRAREDGKMCPLRLRPPKAVRGGRPAGSLPPMVPQCSLCIPWWGSASSRVSAVMVTRGPGVPTRRESPPFLPEVLQTMLFGP